MIPFHHTLVVSHIKKWHACNFGSIGYHFSSTHGIHLDMDDVDLFHSNFKSNIFKNQFQNHPFKIKLKKELNPKWRLGPPHLESYLQTKWIMINFSRIVFWNGVTILQHVCL
jgi:hypothetical protein